MCKTGNVQGRTTEMMHAELSCARKQCISRYQSAITAQWWQFRNTSLTILQGEDEEVRECSMPVSNPTIEDQRLTIARHQPCMTSRRRLLLLLDRRPLKCCQIQSPHLVVTLSLHIPADTIETVQVHSVGSIHHCLWYVTCSLNIGKQCYHTLEHKKTVNHR